MSRTRGMTPHIAALQDMGSPDAAPGSPPWARHVRAQLGAMINQEKSSVYAVRDYIKGMEKYKGYTALEREDGQPFASVQEFVTTRRPFGLGFDPMLHLLVMVETTERGVNKTMQDIQREYIRYRAEHGPAALTRSEAMRQNKHAAKNSGDNVPTVLRPSQRGNQSSYRIAKLRRDHPAIADRLAAGEFPSVSAAERAAGKKAPTAKRLPKDPHKLIALARQEYGEAYLAALRQALTEDHPHASRRQRDAQEEGERR